MTASPRAEIVSADEAARDHAAWADLANGALEPNPFFSPGVALAALRHLPECRDATVLRVWRDAGSGARLVGVLPLVKPRGRALNPFPIRRGQIYGPLSTPLVHPDDAADTLGAMLDALRRAGIAGLLLPQAHEGGPVATALGIAAERRGSRVVTLDRHARALLSSPLAGSDYLRAALETRRRKEAERQRRRLAEAGALRFDLHREPFPVQTALAEFLRLERAGWKGQRGTDLATAPGSADFIGEAGTGEARNGGFRVATLALDRQVIAAGLVLIAGRRAFYFKTAYDERWARFSPGLLLTLDLTARLLDDPDIDDADSLAIADHSMIDRVWTERLPIAALMVSTGRPGPSFVAAWAFERLREEARIRSGRLRSTIAARRSPRFKAAATKSVTASTG